MELLTKTFDINVNDVNCDDKYTLTALLRHFQEAVNLHTKKMGMHIKTLQSNYGVTWIVTKIRVDFVDELPHGDDEITLKTYPLVPGLARMERECEFTCGGNAFALLSSEWCLLSLKSGLPVRPQSAGYPQIEHGTVRLASEYAIVPTTFDESEFVFEHTARFGDIDINNHVNNVIYSALAVNAFSHEEWSALRLKSYQINFFAQTREGETLRIYKKKEQNAVYVVGVLPSGKNAFVACFFTNNA